MKIAKGINIEAVDYASQGNAILGIRDSGKTYTATYLAEQLLDNNIPFIAFDPIGVWRYLKVGKNGKGFPVVVAGDNGDLPLTPESAPNIVRAAMQENVSLVIDLYSMQLSKSDWKKIVESCIRLLLYENKPHGLRHVFIEEASEFVPQVVRPEDGRVYAEIEKLARMGGNASLGYTLINQRAEQVNKAVLELCDCLFLHRQKGRHSLTALGKWLDVADTSNSKEIINSLPSLEQGECWVWMQGSHDPKKVNIPEKKTIHPDRKNPLKVTSGVTADVSTFVSRMKKSLEDIPKQSAKGKTVKLEVKVENTNGTIVADLEAKVSDLKNKLSEERSLRQQAEKKLEIVKAMLMPQYDQLRKVFEELKTGDTISIDNSAYKIWLDKFDGKHKTMLELIIEHKRLDRRRWCVLSGISYNSNWFDKGASQMQKLRLVAKEGNDFVLQQM
jgi:hypothetical protein